LREKLLTPTSIILYPTCNFRPLGSPISLPPSIERAPPPHNLGNEAQRECLPRLPVKEALREAVRHPRMEGAGRGSASTACVRGVFWVALREGLLSAACSWRVLGEGRRTGVHSLCEKGGLAACGDDVAQDLQLRRSRSHRCADAQLAFLPSSSRTSIPTTLIPRRRCPPVHPVSIFPPLPRPLLACTFFPPSPLPGHCCVVTMPGGRKRTCTETATGGMLSLLFYLSLFPPQHAPHCSANATCDVLLHSLSPVGFPACAVFFPRLDFQHCWVTRIRSR